jgi:hypothetical protein
VSFDDETERFQYDEDYASKRADWTFAPSTT